MRGRLARHIQDYGLSQGLGTPGLTSDAVCRTDLKGDVKHSMQLDCHNAHSVVLQKNLEVHRMDGMLHPEENSGDERALGAPCPCNQYV